MHITAIAPCCGTSRNTAGSEDYRRLLFHSADVLGTHPGPDLVTRTTLAGVKS